MGNNRISPKEALFGLAVYLTSRKKSLCFGKNHLNKRLVDYALKFSRANHLSLIPNFSQEVLMGFIGFLMAQESQRVGGKYPCSRMIDLVEQFSSDHFLLDVSRNYPLNLTFPH